MECRAWSVRPIWVCSRRLRPAEETESTTNRLAPSRPINSTTRISNAATEEATTRPTTSNNNSNNNSRFPDGIRARLLRWMTTWTMEWCHHSSHLEVTKEWTNKVDPMVPAPSWTTVFNTWHHVHIHRLDWLLNNPHGDSLCLSLWYTTNNKQQCQRCWDIEIVFCFGKKRKKKPEPHPGPARIFIFLIFVAWFVVLVK